MSAVFTAILAMALGGASPQAAAYDARSRTVVVPKVEGRAVELDGTFSPGEWDGAVRYRIFEGVDLYLAADNEALRIGLKYAAPALFRVVDLFISTSPGEFLNVHASAALAEARLAFPCRNPGPALEFRHVDWDANYLDEAAPPVRIDGNEFRILRRRFGGDRLRLAIRIRDYYPATADLKSADGWVELVLPPL